MPNLIVAIPQFVLLLFGLDWLGFSDQDIRVISLAVLVSFLLSSLIVAVLKTYLGGNKNGSN